MSLFDGSDLEASRHEFAFQAALFGQQQVQQAAIQARSFGGLGGETWDNLGRRELAMRQGQKVPEKPMTFYAALKTEIKEWLKITI